MKNSAACIASAIAGVCLGATVFASGAFLVSAELKSGAVTGVKIISEKGRECTVQNPWPGKKVALAGRERLAGERFAFQTKPGEIVLLAPAEEPL